MRKFLLFSSVAVLSLAVLAQNPVAASTPPADAAESAINENSTINAIGGGINVEDIGVQRGITQLGELLAESLDILSEEIYGYITESLRKQTEALHTVSGILMSQQTATASARDVNATIRAQEGQIAEVRLRHQDQPAYVCAYGSVQQGMGSAESAARERLRVELEERFSVLNCETGTICENGGTDMNLRLYESAMQFCSPTGSGGSALDCTGADDLNSIEHLSIGTLLGRSNIAEGTPTSSDDLQQLTHLQNLLYGHAPLSLNPDLMEDPTSAIEDLYTESDRLRSELGIGQMAFSQALSRRVQPDAGGEGSAEWLRQLLQEGDFLSDTEINEMLPPGTRPSLMGQYDAITLGMMNPNFVLEKLNKNPEHAPLAIVFNTSLANRMMFDMLKELEFIKLAIATNIAASRYEEVRELNARIRAANQR